MFNNIEEFLKDKINDLVFIELKNDKALRAKGFPEIKNIPLPIPLNEVIHKVKSDEDNKNDDISLLKIIEGIIFLIGIDRNFNHNQLYKDFLLAFDSNIDRVVISQGLKFMEAGKKLDGLICFKASLYLNQDNLDGLYNYGRCCLELSYEEKDDSKKAQSFEKEALDVFEYIVTQYPEFPLSYYHLGFCYANSNQFKKAELTWKTFLEMNEDENKEMEVLQVLNKLQDKIDFEVGYTYILNGEPEKGLEILLPISEKFPEWWNLLFFIGLAYRNMGNYEEGINYFKKVLTLQQNQVDTFNELGLCYISIGMTEESIKFFKNALRFRKNDSEILCNLGMAYMEKEDLMSAEEYIEKSYKINPDDEVTLACIEKLNEMKNNV